MLYSDVSRIMRLRSELTEIQEEVKEQGLDNPDKVIELKVRLDMIIRELDQVDESRLKQLFGEE